MKKYIDIESWPRKAQYKLFKQMDYPHFNICANVDITEMYSYVKANDISFFRAMIFITSKIANNITEFKYRMEDDKVVEYDFIHPSFTFLTQLEVFSFCNVNYTDDFQGFLERVEEQIKQLNGKVDIEDEPNRNDRVFITSMPWVSFTSVTHPINFSPSDSIPRIAWGKYFEENGKLKLPVSVQVNHALMDGLHVGRYFSLLQDSLDDPSKNL